MTRQRDSWAQTSGDEAGGRPEETPGGRMNGQTDTAPGRMEEMALESWFLIRSYLFFGCLPPFRGTFKAVLPMYIFFMVCLCSFPLMCL